MIAITYSSKNEIIIIIVVCSDDDDDDNKDNSNSNNNDDDNNNNDDDHLFQHLYNDVEKREISLFKKCYFVLIVVGSVFPAGL